MDIFSVVKMMCGLAFFLFGMKVMSGELEKLSGGKLESLLKKVTSKPLLGVLVGGVIAIAVQSSSAVTVMLVGLVNSSIMTFAQTVYIIFGANIGTTLTSWILSLAGIEGSNIFLAFLKPENFSPIFAFIGVIFVMFSKNDRRKSIGTVFVGFAVLMYGMKFMTDAMSPLGARPEFAELMTKFNNPLLGVLLGLIVTAIIQSSAASVGILQALALTGKISFGMAIPIVMGQNIGTCVTSLISCLGTSSKAKRVAVLHFSIKIFGTVVCLGIYGIAYSVLAKEIFTRNTNPWEIAAIHSVFNLITTLLLAPFSKYLVLFTEKIVQEKDLDAKKKHIFSPDERLLRTPSAAVGECDTYTCHMAENAKEMLLTSFSILCSYDFETAKWLEAQENILDTFEDDIGTFLVKISRMSLSDADARKVSKMLHCIGNFERLGDHAMNLLKTAAELHNKEITFSNSAYNELTVLTDALVEIIMLTVRAYKENSIDLAARVEPLEQVIDSLIEKTHKNHINRLASGDATFELGFVLSDILSNFERISDHCSNIAVAIIEVEHNSFDTHSYLNGVKYGDNDFNMLYNEYRSKYAI